MANVTSVNLTLTPSGANFRVKVDYKLAFTEGELGKKFKIMVELLGVDSGADEDGTPVLTLGDNENVLTQMKFTVRIGGPFSYTIPYRHLTVTTTEINGSVTNVLENKILNEDSGTYDRAFPDILTGEIHYKAWPRRDEIIARVTIIPVEANIGASSTQFITI